MFYLFFVLMFFVVVLITGRLNLNRQFGKEVVQLFLQSGKISESIVSFQKIIDLPEPVQKYFKLVLKEGQPYISYARIKHGGLFKTGLEKSWVKIKGEQYATTKKPGFIWKGTTCMFTARDMYIADKGRIIVSLFSLYNVVDATGEQYNQGELLRWLGESIMYPTNFLPSENLEWVAIDLETAKLTFNYKGLSLFFIATFNSRGEISQMETKRYMDKAKLETWVIKTTNYKEFDHVLLPTAFEVIWRLEKEDFSYAKFEVTDIEFNKPEKF